MHNKCIKFPDMLKISREAIIIRYIIQSRPILLIFIFGAFTYGMIEIIWRGYTHPAMLLLGGICLSFIYFLETRISGINIFYRCLIYSLLITGAEFIFGIVLNLWLTLDIWDYSNVPLNVLGQICLPYTALWYLLSVICCKVCAAFRFIFS